MAVVFFLLAGFGWLATVDGAKARRDPELRMRGRARGKPGPWGQIEYVRLTIGRPDELIPELPRTYSPTRWFFPGLRAADLARLLQDLPVTSAQRLALLDQTNLSTATNGTWVTPPREILLGLDPKARGTIYGILAEDPANDGQRNPYAFLGDSVDAWFRNSRLPKPTEDLVRSLFYQRGNAVCFSDAQVVLPTIPDDEGRHRLLRTLSRQATMLMKLRVTPESNVEELVAYWGRGGKGRALRPFFESLAQVEGGALVDITHFLPPFARDRLYTYPAATDPRAASYDCFWSTMNFFNEVPDMAYLELKQWEAAVKERYRPVNGAPAFGDLVFLLNPEGGAFHAAVYIADEVVFSKNGASYAQPWILMAIPDMVAFYAAEKPVRIVFKRKTATTPLAKPAVGVSTPGP